MVNHKNKFVAFEETSIMDSCFNSNSSGNFEVFRSAF